MEHQESKGVMHNVKDAAKKVQPVVSFVRKHAVLFTLLFVLALQFMPNGGGTYPWGGMYMRMMTKDLPFADSAGASSVDNYLQQQAAVVVAQQYPSLPDASRQNVIADVVRRLKEQQGDALAGQQGQIAQQVRDHYQYEVDGRKFNYMPDIDPYYYLRFARNIVEKGHNYDVLKEGIPWDTHIYAPLGTVADSSWHQHVFAVLYWGGRVFDEKITLMEAAQYYPIVFMLLSMVLAFAIAYRVSGLVGGFFAALMLGLVPAMTGRTLFGHADTDAYQVFFPLLVVWLLTEALGKKEWKQQALFASLTGLAIASYTKFWSGWWYLFDFVLGALAVAFVIELYLHVRKQSVRQAMHNAHLRKFTVVGGAFLVVSLLAGGLFIGFGQFSEAAFSAAFRFSADFKDASHANLWPNVYTTVAELNPSSLSAVVQSVGGPLLFAFACLGIVLLLLKFDEHGKVDITYSVLLALWFAGTAYASLKGIRFILLIGPAFAVAFGAAAGLLYYRLSDFAHRQLHIGKSITAVILALMLGFAIMGPVSAGPHIVRDSYVEATRDVPIVNDAWWNVLTRIKESSEPNAIINSWWDFGHHFKFIADRPVTFDGAVQNSPQAHWIGRVLQTPNEDEAVAILRMLDCGANSAYDVAFNATKDPYVSVSLVKEIIMVDEGEAKALAKAANVPADITRYTHCSPPENFFITSADMVGKSGVWAHFGTWDFARAEVWQKWRLLDESVAVPQMMDRFGWSKETAEQTHRDAVSLGSEDAANQWISGWPSYLGNPAGCEREGAMARCGQVTVNLTSGDSEVRVSQGTAKAGELYVFDRFGNYTVRTINGGNAAIAVVLWPSDGGLSGMPVVRELAASMFTRLFFMDGLGTRHFDKFAEDNQLFGGKIVAWKVNWEGGEAHVPDALRPKSEVVAGAKVQLDYIGWTEDGAVFDSSIVNWQANNVTKDTTFAGAVTKPIEITYGRGQLIAGFEKQIEGMKANQTKTIKIAPEEAYGTDPEAHPLGNKTLNFRIRVVSVQ
ncbi:hypothetical protein C4580_05740 [Candidatus Woesearchaeota archaeon]|nr:MAG: hypothetical protein C4580_05740 [Candidatus Woesearchaeota archaeon]